MEHHLVDEARGQGRSRDTAAHQGDVPITGQCSSRGDGLLDPGVDERLPCVSLGRWSVTEDDQGRGGVRGSAGRPSGVVVGVASGETRPDPGGELVEEARTGCAEVKPSRTVLGVSPSTYQSNNLPASPRPRPGPGSRPVM